jgi:hypothetical protein
MLEEMRRMGEEELARPAVSFWRSGKAHELCILFLPRNISQVPEFSFSL